MKVLIAVDRFPVVSQTFVSSLCAGILDAGHHVTVLAKPAEIKLFDGMPRGEELSRALVPVASHVGDRLGSARHSLRTMLTTRRAFKLCQAIVSDAVRTRAKHPVLRALRYVAAMDDFRQFDIVHTHFGLPAVAMAQVQAAGLCPAPIISTFHGTDLNAQKSAPNGVFYGRVFSRSRLLTTGTRYMDERLREAGIPDDRRVILPMGVDIAQLEWRPRGPQQGPFRIATLGRLIEVKGTEYAIRAIPELLRSGVEAELDVLGDGPLRIDLEALAQELGVAHVVHFHGALPHAKAIALLEQADLYVHPGIVARDGSKEGQGLALIEAQALGLPVVASRVGGIPETVSEGDSATLVEPQDVASLVGAIVALAGDPDRRRTMGEHGRAHVESNFDQRALVAKWIALYKSVQ